MATRDFDEHSITDAVVDRFADTPDPRLKQIVTSLVRHAHDFVRDVELTEAEWLAAVQFLTRTGQICSDDTAGVHPALGHTRHLDAGRCRQPPAAAGRHGDDGARSVLRAGPGGHAHRHEHQ